LGSGFGGAGLADNLVDLLCGSLLSAFLLGMVAWRGYGE
jgi:hypothetical protein